MSGWEGPILHEAPGSKEAGAPGEGMPAGEGHVRWEGDGEERFPGTFWDDWIPCVEH